MRKLFTLLFLFLFSVGLAQTRKDTITGSVDIEYLNSLVLQICNERTKSSNVFKTPTTTTFKCAEYQSSYMAKYSVCTHDNDKVHRGIILPDIRDRVNYFNKGGQPTSISEICTFSYFDIGEITYEELANNIMNNYFNSEPHRKTIFVSYPYGNFSCTLGTYKGGGGVYVTGFFSR